MCICDYVKNRIDTCKKCIFQFEKGYKWIIALGSPKKYCWNLWSFDEARNFVIERKWNKDMGRENFLSTRFLHLRYSEVQRTVKWIMFRPDFSQYEIYSKSFTKTLYGKKILVSECIFKLVSHCEGWKWSQI